MFSSEFFKMFENTYFVEQLRTTAPTYLGNFRDCYFFLQELWRNKLFYYLFYIWMMKWVCISQASKCIILSFFCKFGYQNETVRNYYLALKKYKNAWRQMFWTLKSGKWGFTLGRVSCGQKIQFFRIFANFTQF